MNNANALSQSYIISKCTVFTFQLILLAISVMVAHGAKFGDTSVYGQVQVSLQRSQLPPLVENPVDVHNKQGHDNILINDSKPVKIIQQDIVVNPDGSYHNVWESENGIKVQEEGTVKVIGENTVVQTVNGNVAYTDNNNNRFLLSFTADENGYRPVGEHLPTPPPIPFAIVRALKYIADHPSATVEHQSFADNDRSVVEIN